MLKVGTDEEYEEEQTGAGVFYVHRSLLIQNSKYFAGLLNSNSQYEMEVVYVKLTHANALEDWMDALYRGSTGIALSGLDVHISESVKHYFEFADLVGSEWLKNMVMDELQKRGAERWDLNSLRAVPTLSSSMALLADFIVENAAYRIVENGWASFMGSDGGTEGTEWNEFVTDKANMGLLQDVMLRIDKLHKEKDQGKLVCPSKRKDCRWHEHTDKEDEKQCPRYGGDEINAAPPGNQGASGSVQVDTELRCAIG